MHGAVSGDLVLTYGAFRWWPPKYILRTPLYAAIRDFQRDRYPILREEHPEFMIPPAPAIEATHVYIYIGNGLCFEFTMPKARFVRWEEAGLDKKRISICRWNHDVLPGYATLMARARAYEGDKYDIGDLLDFRLTGWLKVLQGLRVFGDRARELNVCSTGAVALLSAYGVRTDYPADPAWFENVKRDWRVVWQRPK